MSTVATGSWLSELKSEARAAFTRLGFPTTAMEEWQFTPLGALPKTVFSPAPATVPGLTTAALDPLTFPGANALASWRSTAATTANCPAPCPAVG